MDSPDRQLLTGAYWKDSKPDLRLNPLVPFGGEGLDEFLASEPNLKSHVVFATSGSSGAPKMVCLSKSALLASAEMVNEHLGASDRDRWLCALPTFHVGGFGIWARASLAGSRVSQFEGRWKADRFLEACYDQSVSLASLVSVQIFDLVQAGLQCPKSLRAVIVGGGPLGDDLGNRARQLGWPVLQSYGMTESGSQIATQTLSSLEQPFQHEQIPVLDSWDVRTNGERQIEIRGSALFSGYVEKSERGWKFESPIDPEGWFVTEDLGQLEGNTLRIEGRGGRTIKILGELVNLDQLESYFLELTGEMAPKLALATLPDERSGQRLLAVHEPGLDENHLEMLIADFNRNVAPFERIDRLVRLEHLPRSPLGKLQRRRLTAMIEESEQSSAAR